MSMQDVTISLDCDSTEVCVANYIFRVPVSIVDMRFLVLFGLIKVLSKLGNGEMLASFSAQSQLLWRHVLMNFVFNVFL